MRDNQPGLDGVENNLMQMGQFIQADRPRGEEGLILLNVLPTHVRNAIGVTAMAMVAGLSANFLLHDYIKQETTIDPGKASVSEISLTLPEMCSTSYVAKVSGTSAEYKKSFDAGLFDVGLINRSKVFNGELVVDVCSERTEMTGKPNNENGEYEVTLATTKPMIVKVYRKNPEVGSEFETDGSLSAAFQPYIEKIISGLPPVGPVPDNLDATSAFESTLEGYSVVAATEMVTKSCTPKVLSAAKEEYSGIIAQDYMNQIDQIAPAFGQDNPYTKDQIKVNLPEISDMVFEHQYKGTIDELNKLDSITVTGKTSMVERCDVEDATISVEE